MSMSAEVGFYENKIRNILNIQRGGGRTHTENLGTCMVSDVTKEWAP